MRIPSPVMSMKGSRPTQPTKLVMLGTPAVGKSALVVRYLTRRFIWEYDPTLEFTYKQQPLIDDELSSLEILDTAGQAVSTHAEGHVRWGDGFMLVYSVTDKDSFQQLTKMKQFIEDVRRTRNVPIVIVGNKTDLAHAREISVAQGEQLAADWTCAFFEVSACDGGTEIEDAYHELFREVRRRKTVDGKTRRRSSAQQVRHAISKMITKKLQTG